MISIIMPVYNTPVDWLQQSILSCLNQTYQNFELIVIDNDSSSQETLSFYKRIKNIKNIKIMNCPKQKGKRGVAVALNAGINASRYDYIARMDSDDWMYPERLEKQLNYLQNNPNVYVVGTQMKILQTQQITQHPLVLNKDTISRYDTGWFMNHPTVMIRKDLFRKIGAYAEEPELFPEDFELWSRCLAANLEIRNMPDCLLNYNQHGQNVSKTDVKSEWMVELNKYRERFL